MFDAFTFENGNAKNSYQVEHGTITIQKQVLQNEKKCLFYERVFKLIVVEIII
jgi:hypothetical protein